MTFNAVKWTNPTAFTAADQNAPDRQLRIRSRSAIIGTASFYHGKPPGELPKARALRHDAMSIIQP
jgi:hypothetical protein